MKTLLLVLSLFLTTTVVAEDYSKFKKAPAKKGQTRTVTNSAELENRIVQLELELRETRRKYYAAKTELEDLKKAQPAEEVITQEQVDALVAEAQNEVYYGALMYTIGERRFLRTLTDIREVHWLLGKMNEHDIERVISIVGTEDLSYEEHIKSVMGEYQSYYDAIKEAMQADLNPQPVESEEEETASQ